MPHEQGTHCRESSIAGGESLAGTAAESTDLWVAVEHREPWGRKIPKDTTDFEPAVAIHLGRLAEALPTMRLELIRQPQREGPLRVFVGRSRPSGHRLVQLEIESLAALMSLDLQALADGRAEAAPVDEPLYLVCTHGQRDACCAKWGFPIYEALHERAPDRVWQCSHLGGHRFAPTLLTLPHGLCYGRVELGEVGALFDATERGQIHDPRRLRGRTAYTRAVQAAEVHLLVNLGLRDAGALTLARTEPLGQQRWRVYFRGPDGTEHAMQIERTRGAMPCLGSCGDAPELPSVYRVC